MEEETLRLSGSLSARVSALDGTARVDLSGELDLDGASAAEQQLSHALAEHSRLILDLSGLTFLDSTGISALVRTKHESEERDVELVIRIGSSSVRRVLELVRVSEFLGVSD